MHWVLVAAEAVAKVVVLETGEIVDLAMGQVVELTLSATTRLPLTSIELHLVVMQRLFQLHLRSQCQSLQPVHHSQSLKQK